MESAGTGAAGAPQAGHELDKNIGDALAAGMQGKISAGDTVGLVSLGVLGNAILAPNTPVQPKTAGKKGNVRIKKMRAR